MRANKKTSLGVAFSVASAFWILFAAQHVAWATGITVAPAVLKVSLADGAEPQISAVSIKNEYEVPISVAVEVRSAESEAADSAVDAVGLSAFSLAADRYDLAPGNSKNIIVTITNSDDLPPGTSYATIAIRQTGEPSQQVALTQSISVPVQITKESGGTRELRASLRDVGFVAFSSPSFVDLVLTAGGNIAITPRASVQLFDGRDLQFGSGATAASVPELHPGEATTQRVSLTNERPLWWPQRVTILARYRYDGQVEPARITKTLWVVPPRFVLALGGALLFLGLIVRRMRAVRKLTSSTRKAEET